MILPLLLLALALCGPETPADRASDRKWTLLARLGVVPRPF